MGYSIYITGQRIYPAVILASRNYLQLLHRMYIVGKYIIYRIDDIPRNENLKLKFLRRCRDGFVCVTRRLMLNQACATKQSVPPSDSKLKTRP